MDHLGHSILDNNVTYTQELCLELHEEELVSSKCNCTFFGLLRSQMEYNPEMDCTTGERGECWERESKNFNNLNYTRQCPMECETVLFSYSVVNFDTVSNLVDTKIYYNSLIYTEITQVAKTSGIELFAYLGGLLGLFLGIDFLSFVEILDFSLQAL